MNANPHTKSRTNAGISFWMDVEGTVLGRTLPEKTDFFMGIGYPIAHGNDVMSALWENVLSGTLQPELLR